MSTKQKSRFTNKQYQIKSADIAFNNVGDYLHRKKVMTEDMYNQLLLESEYEMRDKYGEKPEE